MENGSEAIARRRAFRLIRTGRLTDLRESTGLSQGDVSRHLGVSQASVSRWESGQAIPRGPHAVALLELLEGEA
jgi:DNA-binding transcriptional regulator YiaG